MKRGKSKSGNEGEKWKRDTKLFVDFFSIDFHLIQTVRIVSYHVSHISTTNWETGAQGNWR
jgi:hypothetical protein